MDISFLFLGVEGRMDVEEGVEGMTYVESKCTRSSFT
jgi:hypothetical protein